MFLLHLIQFAVFILFCIRIHGIQPTISFSTQAYGVTCVVLSIFFLFQEFRQFLDSPSTYISLSNAIDLYNHGSIIYFVSKTLFTNTANITLLLVSLTIVFHAIKSILLLRIVPSIGPKIRLCFSAFLNILPLIFPISNI